MSSSFREGLALHQKGLLAEADAIYRQVLASQPTHVDALHFSGVIALQRHDYAQALALMDRAIGLAPDSPQMADAYVNRGAVLRGLQRIADAVASYDKAIVLQPKNTAAYYNRGNALRDLGRLDAAIASYDQVLALEPKNAEAITSRDVVATEINAEIYNNHGNKAWLAGDAAAALENYDKAVALKPERAGFHSNRGITLNSMRRHAEAIAAYDRAIACDAGFADAYNNRGVALAALRRFDDALASYAQALNLKPDYAEVYNNRGTVHVTLKNYRAAIDDFTHALGLKPNDANALYNRGNALHDVQEYAAAIADYEVTARLAPDYPLLAGIHLHVKMKICDWRNLAPEIAALEDRLARGETACPPFPALSLTGSPALQRKAAGTWAAKELPPGVAPIAARTPSAKIRVGYFSMDLRNHPVAYLILRLIALHDRAHFEIVAFSYGPNSGDETRKALEKSFDTFLDVAEKTDAEIAALAREMEIDIAVDLAGFTKDSRTGIFAHRAAPVQVSYLGYPGTMGVAYMDYIIGDSIVIPDDAREHYMEKVVRLPHSYQATDNQLAVADIIFTREDVGLPPIGFVFCCFNNNYKITPDVFALWMRILKRVDGSVLWLIEDNAAAAANLRKAAQAAGVAETRLVFAKRIPHGAHLARHRLADLFLDTLPYNAHTTASDALWCGVPVLTYMNDAFAGRVASSLLRAVGLGELIAASPQAYEDLAVRLATDRPRLTTIRETLARNRLTTPLFDSALFTRHMEEAFRSMIARRATGLAPEHIDVAAAG